ncbi:MAG: hypothetical protein R8J85_03330 [Mariprofundales bacterium]
MRLTPCLLAIMLLASLPASAADWKVSVDDRADALAAQLKEAHDYHAYLALQYADKAVDERSQHDLVVAKQFMAMAEREAAKVGKQ